MESGRGNRSFSQTPPSSAPPPSPQSYLPFYHSLEPNQEFSYFGLDGGEFIGRPSLNVSTLQNQGLSYPGLVGGEFLERSRHGYGGGRLARTEQESNVVQGLNVGFDGVRRVGLDIVRWDTFMSTSYQPFNLTRNSQNGLDAVTVAAAGVSFLGAFCSRNENARRYSLSSHNNDDKYNHTYNSFRRPYWLQEPPNCLSLVDLRGHFVFSAKDRHDSPFLQRAIEKVPKKEIDMMLMEVIDHVRELMFDPLANYVFQKLVDRCSVEQKNQIVSVVVKDGFGLVDICLNVHGTHAVQKLLENLTKPQISSVMSVLTVALSEAKYGHYVIYCCLKNFYDKDNKYLPNEVADNYQIVTDQSGARAQLVVEIIANALHLAEDQYGSVVQT
ncbi:hypothetical protein PTKIN_Ptkin09bG0144700 [Pterospermum kingtungense]